MDIDLKQDTIDLSDTASVFRPRGYKTFFMLNSTEQKKITMLINVKMPTVVGILTFISMINTTSEDLKARKVFIFSVLEFMSS